MTDAIEPPPPPPVVGPNDEPSCRLGWPLLPTSPRTDIGVRAADAELPPVESAPRRRDADAAAAAAAASAALAEVAAAAWPSFVFVLPVEADAAQAVLQTVATADAATRRLAGGALRRIVWYILFFAELLWWLNRISEANAEPLPLCPRGRGRVAARCR